MVVWGVYINIMPLLRNSSSVIIMFPSDGQHNYCESEWAGVRAFDCRRMRRVRELERIHTPAIKGKRRHIYTIICIKSVCRSTFADCRSQFLLDRLGRCLKLIVSYRGTSSHEFASQFGLDIFIREKTPKPQSARSLTVRATDRQNGATI